MRLHIFLLGCPKHLCISYISKVESHPNEFENEMLFCIL